MKRFLLIFWLLPCLAGATNYYVSAGSGNDGNAGTIASPWQHATKVCTTMVAGDTAFFAGTFPPESTLTASSFYCTIRPSNSGTSDNWIVYMRWPDSAMPVFQGPASSCASSSCWHVTIFNDQSYIEFNGLEQIRGYHGIWLYGGIHMNVKNCKSTYAIAGLNQNVGCVYLGTGSIGGPHNILIDSCELAHPCEVDFTQLGGWNSAGIYVEGGGHNVTAEYNTIYDQGGFGIRWKNRADTLITRFNTIHDCSQGIEVCGASTAHSYVYGNLIYDVGGFGIEVSGGNAPTYTANYDVYVFNNTIYNSSSSAITFWATSQIRDNGVHLFNNIFSRCSGYTIRFTCDTDAISLGDTIYTDYNRYDDSTRDYSFERTAGTATSYGGTAYNFSYTNIAAWRNNGLYFWFGNDSNSIFGINPGFADSANDDFSIASWAYTFRDTTIVVPWSNDTLTFTGMGYDQVTTNGGQPGEENPHTPIQRRTGNVKTTGDKVIIE